MRWCLITGSYPPQVCGVGDYTKNLVEALKATGEAVVVFDRIDWSISKLWRYLSDLRALDADLYLMQYPTEGYGYSVVPQLVMLGLLGRRRVVTLHEYFRKSLKGKMAIYAFFSPDVTLSSQTSSMLGLLAGGHHGSGDRALFLLAAIFPGAPGMLANSIFPILG